MKLSLRGHRAHTTHHTAPHFLQVQHHTTLGVSTCPVRIQSGRIGLSWSHAKTSMKRRDNISESEIEELFGHLLDQRELYGYAYGSPTPSPTPWRGNPNNDDPSVWYVSTLSCFQAFRPTLVSTHPIHFDIILFRNSNPTPTNMHLYFGKRCTCERML